MWLKAQGIGIAIASLSLVASGIAIYVSVDQARSASKEAQAAVEQAEIARKTYEDQVEGEASEQADQITATFDDDILPTVLTIANKSPRPILSVEAILTNLSDGEPIISYGYIGTLGSCRQVQWRGEGITEDLVVTFLDSEGETWKITPLTGDLEQLRGPDAEQYGGLPSDFPGLETGSKPFLGATRSRPHP